MIKKFTFADILVQKRTEYYEQCRIEKEELKNEIKNKCNEYFLSELYKKITTFPLLDIFNVQLDYKDKNSNYLLKVEELVDIVKTNIKPIEDFNIINVSEDKDLITNCSYGVNITVRPSEKLLQKLRDIPV